MNQPYQPNTNYNFFLSWMIPVVCLSLFGILLFGENANGQQARFQVANPVEMHEAENAKNDPSVSMSDAPVRLPEAIEIFRCSFGENVDINYDLWPDHWLRTKSQRYPRYVKMEIVDQPKAYRGRALQITLDGGRAQVSTPMISVMPRFSYVLSARLRTEELKRNSVQLALNFFNKEGKILQSVPSKIYHNTNGWTMIHLGPFSTTNIEIDRAQVTLTVDSEDRGDLKGKIWLDDLWIGRLPSMIVTTENPSNIFTDPSKVVIHCHLSGIQEQNPHIRFILRDATNQMIHKDQVELNGKLIIESSLHASDIISKKNSSQSSGYEGSKAWSPPITEPGFYVIEVKMESSQKHAKGETRKRLMQRKLITVVVVPPMDREDSGEFGWTLNKGDDPLSFDHLQDLLPLVGINWVKFPVWYDAKDQKRGDSIVQFIELLGNSNIESIGILDKPPENTKAAKLYYSSVADIFTLDPSLWLQEIDPVIARLALRLHWWQFGNDYDTNFIGYHDPNLKRDFKSEKSNEYALNQKIHEIRELLYRFGQEVKVGIGWRWKDAPEVPGAVPWDFQQYSSDSPVSPKELAASLSKKPLNDAKRWVLIEPLPKRLSLDLGIDKATSRERKKEHINRIRNLVEQITTAKIYGASGIFISRPFDNVQGLMYEDGTPGELLLPWRTTATLLSGATFLGELQLPNRSPNQVFRRSSGEVVMIVWNDKKTQEDLFLGTDVWQTNISGITKSIKNRKLQIEELILLLKQARKDKQALLDELALKQTQTTADEKSLAILQAVIATRMRVVKQAIKNKHNQLIEVGPLPIFIRGLDPAVTELRLGLKIRSKNIASVFGVPHKNGVLFKNTFSQGISCKVKIPAPTDRWDIEIPGQKFQLTSSQNFELPFQSRLQDALAGKQELKIQFEIEAAENYKFVVYRDIFVGQNSIKVKIHSYIKSNGWLYIEQTMTNSEDKPINFTCVLKLKGHRREIKYIHAITSQTDHRSIYKFPNGKSLLGKKFMLRIEEGNGPRVFKYRFLVKDQGPPVKAQTVNKYLDISKNRAL